VLLEVAILGGDDGLAEHGSDVLVAHDDAPFGGELADDAALRRRQAGDGIGQVAVERTDLGDVVGKGEQYATHRPEARGQEQQHADGHAPGNGVHQVSIARAGIFSI